MVLYELLNELPLLESLFLDGLLSMNISIDLTNNDLTQLLNFKDFKMILKVDNLNTTSNVLNVEASLSVHNKFNDSMIKKTIIQNL